MKNILRTGAAVLLFGGLTLGSAQADVPYRSGGVYTNAGAREYHRTIRASRGGVIYNVAPKPRMRPKRSQMKLKVPKKVSFKHSPMQELPPRYIQHGRERINLSPIVEKYAKRYDLDPILIEEVIRQESNFKPTAVSRTGAQGLMQLMPGTADMLGVSDSNNPRQNVRGGSRYLAEQLTTFGRLDLALAAYNAGPGSVRAHGGIPPYAETRNYVSKIVRSYNKRVQQERRKARKNG